MRPRYVPRDWVREDIGFATLHNDMLGILAPAEYVGPALIDPSKATGYMHCFLRPFQSLMLGRWHAGKGEIVQFRNLRTIVYVLVEEPGIQGLRCAGAIALAKARRGFTLASFPCTERRDIHKREVDHFSAHVEFDNGKIVINKIHAKMRKEGETHPKVNVPLERMKSDDYHFAFEYWIGDVLFLDPAGSVVSPLKSVWSSNGENELESRVNKTRVNTMGCSVPTLDGTISSGPLLIRIGLLTEAGKARAGSVQRALSQPHAADKGEHATRIHRYKDISKLDDNWPIEVSLFVEIGLLRFQPPKHYTYPDLKRSTFESQ